MTNTKIQYSMFTIEEWKIISDCLTYAESEGRWTEDEVNSILVKLPSASINDSIYKNYE